MNKPSSKAGTKLKISQASKNKDLFLVHHICPS